MMGSSPQQRRRARVQREMQASGGSGTLGSSGQPGRADNGVSLSLLASPGAIDGTGLDRKPWRR